MRTHDFQRFIQTLAPNVLNLRVLDWYKNKINYRRFGSLSFDIKGVSRLIHYSHILSANCQPVLYCLISNFDQELSAWIERKNSLMNSVLNELGFKLELTHWVKRFNCSTKGSCKVIMKYDSTERLYFIMLNCDRVFVGTATPEKSS